MLAHFIVPLLAHLSSVKTRWILNPQEVTLKALGACRAAFASNAGTLSVGAADAADAAAASARAAATVSTRALAVAGVVEELAVEGGG